MWMLCFVTGLISLMNGDYSQPVNLGNPEEYSVKVHIYVCDTRLLLHDFYRLVVLYIYICVQQFASLIKQLTASNSTIRFLPKTIDDPRQRKPDISTAQTKLGWSPQVCVYNLCLYFIVRVPDRLDSSIYVTTTCCPCVRPFM